MIIDVSVFDVIKEPQKDSGYIPSSTFVNLRLIAPFSDFTANVIEVSADG